ncbi:multicomponent Na+:H+ antiporter subunit B [Sedimentibacter acidaminivorans]|uniref:Multicomponent Na+:H+ antiporter subunit B n=1 Tax=Sedimentibacter acidaminivorans TaxID=913099 RepID=A0ABS4GE70_9FIRM|nr:hydrogen gas-evolving membrane-bound hydrogenase subunit E [Sedimentibacter acidaminivorans]MBP1926001.1 multicomponent Na+:H+ antiporter subunit B [Sedimentibacter acidaminivorans]
MRKIIAVFITLGITIILLIGSENLPQFGTENTPANNDLTKYYIENSIKDTGATNIVTGVILDYRAFDTFIESSVLFTAAIVVMILLKKEKS